MSTSDAPEDEHTAAPHRLPPAGTPLGLWWDESFSLLLESQTTGYLLGFPATLFLSSVLRMGSMWSDAQGGKSTTTRPTCYVSKHTMVYDKGE